VPLFALPRQSKMRMKADFFASETLNYAFYEQRKTAVAPFWCKLSTACTYQGQQ
jgi:hypothetical protein